ncbi:ROK family transcriptional regulator [Streptomyces sp. LP11]|uniref:ROK family transcriptional regulator n=1 Tax=Streptomyces pyxinicus TaxID=2970331 RepID=A0ABT2B543_9ACTN|nr:ROK family transcriptional regulator [Streptomyces sp. LP11]MCS0603542.1 ROK family transcriptional regulator [Streptomyces sp. LP11]
MKQGPQVIGALSRAPSAADGRGVVRRANLAVLLRLLRDAGPRSRARIAEETGLPKPTVTSLVAELAGLGLVREGVARREGSVGRPGALVHLDGRDIAGVGVEVSTSYLHVIALGLDGETAFESRTALAAGRAGAGAVLDLVAAAVRDCLAALDAAGSRAVGLTFAAPGVVDASRGMVSYAPALGWRDVPVVGGLRDRLGATALAVTVENDAKAGAVAEYLRARKADVHDLVCVTGERGIGAGIISGGRLLRGFAGYAGEVGHMPLGAGGRVCVCGRRGCWETVVGLGALLSDAADGTDAVHDDTVPLEERLGELRRRAAAGDPRTAEALRRVADGLGVGIALLADVLNPAAVVLGGYFSHIGDLMLDDVRTAVRDRVMAPDGGGCRVSLSTLGFTAAARGGAHLALDAVYRDPRLAAS